MDARSRRMSVTGAGIRCAVLDASMPPVRSPSLRDQHRPSTGLHAGSRCGASRLMPIRRQHRYFYPIDWPQLSAVIRFRRAGGRLRRLWAPPRALVYILAMGAGGMRGRLLARWPGAVVVRAADDRGPGLIRMTKVVLATAHRDHDTSQQQASQPRCLLPALPHAARPARAQTATLANAVPAQGRSATCSGTVCLEADRMPRLLKPSGRVYGLALDLAKRIGLIAREPMEKRDQVAINGVGTVMGRYHSDHRVFLFADESSEPYRA